MKRKIWALLLVTIALLMVTALAEEAGIMPLLIDPSNCDEHEALCSEPNKCWKCGVEYTGDNISHQQGEGYQHDDDTHWLGCACGEIRNRSESHRRDCTADVCSVCDASYHGDTVEHIGSLEEKYDEEYHWQWCLGCEKESRAKERHIRDCISSICTICRNGYTGDNKTHTEKVYKYDGSSHWLGCNNCEEVDEAAESHAVTCANPSVCTVCKHSVSGLEAPHTVSGYEHNADSHWQVCSVCGQEVNKESHSFADDAPCAVCGATNGTTTDPDDPDKKDPDDGDDKDPDNGDDKDPDGGDDKDPDGGDDKDPDGGDDKDPDGGDDKDPDGGDDKDPDGGDDKDPDNGDDDGKEPEKNPEPEVTEPPVVTDAPEITDAPEAEATPTPAETPDTTETPDATATPAPTKTPRPKATAGANANDDSFLSRFQSNSEMAAGGDILSGTVEETVTLVMEATEEEAGYAGSELVIYATNSRNDGVTVSLNCRYAPEGMLSFRTWQESMREVSILRETESFGGFVELAHALVQALLPDRTAEDVDAMIVAILQSGFDGTLEGEDLRAMSFDEDIEGEVVGYLAQDGCELILVLRKDGVTLLVRELD